MKHKSKWKEILDKYILLKSLYIECEETDKELKTNLQPLNEFRAALDHIFRIIDNEITADDEQVFDREYDKLCSHIRRAFFDVCDHLSINYRDKIISTLERYSGETIRAALPDYYSKIRPAVEEISIRISKYRMRKGAEPDENIFDAYYNDVVALRNYSITVLKASASLSELHGKEETEKKKIKLFNLLSIAVGVVGIIVGILVGILT
ncbi:MAG: hypothetical protein LBP26_06360 [Clostridiales bacterium]|jgi:hypothetical protein|nr:hypothetical protein [Clostridiales bacterium]